MLSIGIRSLLVAMYLKEAKIPNSEVFLQKRQKNKSSHVDTPNQYENLNFFVVLLYFSQNRDTLNVVF